MRTVEASALRGPSRYALDSICPRGHHDAMYEVIVSDRFAVWYEGLPEALAEEVTLALDVAARLGKTIDPARSRQLLLWFDGSGE